MMSGDSCVFNRWFHFADRCMSPFSTLSSVAVTVAASPSGHSSVDPNVRSFSFRREMLNRLYPLFAASDSFVSSPPVKIKRYEVCYEVICSRTLGYERGDVSRYPRRHPFVIYILAYLNLLIFHFVVFQKYT